MKQEINIRSIDDIRINLKNEDFIFSHHAFLRSIERNISVEELVECSDNLDIIENYPDDKYSPSALTLGFTKVFRPLHIQITTDSSTTMKIITVYEPESEYWINNYSKRLKS